MDSKCGIPMGNHGEADSFFKISGEIRNQKRREYSHGTELIVSDDLWSVVRSVLAMTIQGERDDGCNEETWSLV
ncbi:hypothetical protein T4C_791 [Trichinella pseudospiralis]|uniref:Uncharacterized protein n=1 Tax=Trichinella pseudospiralis TaxID=6337 RepID=A0A0V1J7Y5_TRIPS|nr:hypothetical protein T4C_791 [Trichinella pseudospiralis]